MPMGYFDADGTCVANLSGFSMPLVIDGKTVRAAGFQSGAVRPAFRGKGLYRDLMRKVFDWQIEAGFEIGILLTDKPSMYEPYGFRTVLQHRFVGVAPMAGDAVPARSLSIYDDADVATMLPILASRQPVSERFAVIGEAKTFLLNACFDPDVCLSLMPDQNAIIAWKSEGHRLLLLDIAAVEIPPLSAIHAALGGNFAEVEVFFGIDRLSWTGQAKPYRGSCDLMIRGDLEPAAGASMLSPMADF